MAITHIDSKGVDAGRAASETFTLGAAGINAGDLLVGIFQQFDSTAGADQLIHVSDNVNGAWTRASASRVVPQNELNGDVMICYVANAASAPSGITVTIAVAAGGTTTFLQGVGSVFRGTVTTGPIASSFANAKGTSTTPNSGASVGSVAAGSLVYCGIITEQDGGLTFTNGTSQGVSFVTGLKFDNFTADEYILSAAGGTQDGNWTIASADWNCQVIAFAASTGGTITQGGIGTPWGVQCAIVVTPGSVPNDPGKGVWLIQEVTGNINVAPGVRKVWPVTRGSIPNSFPPGVIPVEYVTVGSIPNAIPGVKQIIKVNQALAPV